MRGCFHPAQTLASATQKRRSVLCSRGRVPVSLVDGELMAQGQVLQGELAMAAEEEGEEANQVEQESNHRFGLCPDQSREINHLPAGRGFGEGQEALIGECEPPPSVLFGI